MTSTTSRTRSSVVRRLAASALCALLLGFGAPFSGAAGATEATAGARAVVDETVEQVLTVLRDGDLSQPQRQEQIEAIALERFDWATISRLVLARNWKRFSPEQRDAFIEEFKNYLSENYGSRIEGFNQQSVEIVEERLEPRGDVTVKTRILGGEADGTTVDYRLRKREGPWLVIDVVIEGVSVVSSFRSQFQEVLADGSPDDLLERLREKNLGPAPGTESAPSAS